MKPRAKTGAAAISKTAAAAISKTAATTISKTGTASISCFWGNGWLSQVLPTRAGCLLCLCLLLCLALAAAPPDYRHHVGVYVWGTGASDLPRAAADVKRLGADQVVRLYAGPTSGALDTTPLDITVGRPDYRAFLAAFPVVMLTAYDAASFERYKGARLPPADLARTTAEFRRFTLALARTPGRKIVSNWEFENDCLPANWTGCTEYYQARLDGIAQGKRAAKAAGYPGEILTAFEFTRVPGFQGKPSGLEQVGTKLKGVDYLSYSAWWSIRWNGDPPTVRKDFEYLANLLRGYATAHQLSTRLIIGEFGEYWDQHTDAARLKAMVDGSLASGVEYLFNWVLYDQPGKTDEWGRDASHYGKYRQDGSLTPQGEAFRKWFARSAGFSLPRRDSSRRSAEFTP